MTKDQFLTLFSAARDPWIFLSQHVITQDPVLGERAYHQYSYLRATEMKRRFVSCKHYSIRSPVS